MLRCLKILFFSTVCLLGLIGAYLMVISVAGPYADSQAARRVYKPIENISVGGSASLPFKWNVDGRFLLDFGDGVVIKSGTNLDSLPKDWVLRQSEFPSTATGGAESYDVSTDSISNFMAITVDDSGNILLVELSLYKKDGVWLVDQKTQRRFKFYDVVDQDVIDFLESLKGI